MNIESFVKIILYLIFVSLLCKGCFPSQEIFSESKNKEKQKFFDRQLELEQQKEAYFKISVKK